MKTLTSSRLGGLAVLLIAIFTLSSCLKDLSDDEPQDVSALNVINASPGPLTINFFLNNNLVNGPSLAFGQESSYLLTASGTRKFDAAIGGTFQSIVTDTLELEKDTYYSIFITGSNESPSTFVTEDNLTPPASGQAHIRFINLGTDAGALTLSIKDGNELFSGQAYKTASEFKPLNPSAYMLQLRNPDGSVEYETSLDVVAGRIYTVWAGGLREGTDNTELRIFTRANN